MEVLGLIIIALIWFFKAAVDNEDKKSKAELKEKNEESGGQSSWKPRTYADVLTGSMSVGGAMQNINDALDELGTRREKKQEEKRPSGAQIRDFHKNLAAQERASSEKRWEAARKKQADRGEVHSVHMDSCEDRLESLKVLYDAGILDREEYAQRVARVKKAHAQSRG